MGTENIYKVEYYAEIKTTYSKQHRLLLWDIVLSEKTQITYHTQYDTIFTEVKIKQNIVKW